jgi:hypothetical protein
MENQRPRISPGRKAALTLRLLGDAAAGEILVSPHVGHLVEEWCELQAREVLLGDRLFDRTGAYTVISSALGENHSAADGDPFPLPGGSHVGSNG